MFDTRLMRWTGWPLLIMVSTAVGCGQDAAGPIDDESSALVGAWDATHWELEATADPDITFDLVLMGVSFTLEFTADARFVATFGFAGEALESLSGGVTLSGNQLILDFDSPDEDSATYRYSITGSMLTLTRTTAQDVDGDGMDEAVRETLTLKRRQASVGSMAH